MSQWQKVPLNKVAEIERDSINPSAITDGTTYVGLENIETGGLFVNVRKVTKGELASSKFAFTDKHILYGKLRPYLAKIARPTFSGICSTDILPILPNSEINRDYLTHFLCQSSMIELATSRSTGANLPRLSPKILAEFSIPLPPINQQKRIAAILDKAEELRRLRRQSIEHLDVLSRSIFIEMFGDPTINRKGWKKGCLGDVASFIGGGTPKRDCSEYFEGSICWATSKDMKSEFLEDTQEHITSQAIKESSTNLVPIGTILIVIKSKILMHSLPLAITKVPICFNQDIKAITISQSCESIFVVMALRYGKKWLLDRARGANTEGLTLDHLKAFPLILPPLPLQQEFAQRIEAIEFLKAQHRESLAHLDTLFASLQHRAFRGEL